MTYRSKDAQTLYSHTQLVGFLQADYTLFAKRKHKNYRNILVNIAKHADSSKDWTCYRNQTAIAKSVGVHICTVKRVIKAVVQEGLLEIPIKEVRELNDGGVLMGRNCYRFTDKLLGLLGLKRDKPCIPLVKLRDLWNGVKTITANVYTSSRNLGYQT
ncbi:conserved hypothetical protein [Vibrio crassostreae]|nr:conserved hypothetical protein [Vibrio crassostreae]